MGGNMGNNYEVSIYTFEWNWILLWFHTSVKAATNWGSTLKVLDFNIRQKIKTETILFDMYLAVAWVLWANHPNKLSATLARVPPICF